MTNSQLAAARKAMNGFPGVRPTKLGDTIVPVRAGSSGAPVTVTDSMSPSDVASLLRQSCAAING